MSKYMMATKAFHQFAGDISREQPELCSIEWETNTHYIGSWAEGLGLIGVKFPKETTRNLTPEEIKRFNGQRIGTPGSLDYKTAIKPPVVEKPIEIEKIEVPKMTIPKGAKLVECYETANEYVICGEVDDNDEDHNCDEMGCGTFSHVIARYPRNPPLMCCRCGKNKATVYDNGGDICQECYNAEMR